MTNVLPLPVYPAKPTGYDLEILKQAKALIPGNILIQPVRAVLGSPGRIIALREKPYWVCEYAFIPKPTVESFKSALEWALELKEDARGITVIKVLKEIFGEHTREL